VSRISLSFQPSSFPSFLPFPRTIELTSSFLFICHSQPALLAHGGFRVVLSSSCDDEGRFARFDHDREGISWTELRECNGELRPFFSSSPSSLLVTTRKRQER